MYKLGQLVSGTFQLSTMERMGLRRGLIKYWSCERFSCDVVLYHDFDIVSFTFNCDVGRKGAFDDL